MLRNILNNAVIFLFILLATACQGSRSYFSASGFDNSTLIASGNGNGEGFEGRISVPYMRQDLNHPCPDVSGEGQPLPNDLIEVSGKNPIVSAQLVRKSCIELDPPQDLNPADLQSAPDGSGNLIYQGQTFTPAPAPAVSNVALTGWAGVGSGATVDSNPSPAVLLPDGVTPSELATESTAMDYHSVSTTYNQAAPGMAYTGEIYVQPAGRSIVALMVGDTSDNGIGCGCSFDLNAGSELNPWQHGPSSFPTCAIQPAGAGWYHLSIRCVVNQTGRSITVGLSTYDSTVGDGLYQGTGSTMVYFGSGLVSW